MNSFLFGRLTLEALPHEWFTLGGTIFMTGALVGFVTFLIKIKKLKWLWKEWLTSTDPKKIGAMYIIIAALMLARGGLDAGMIWFQQSIAGSGQSFLSAQHFQEIFTAHGVIMVFFVASGLMFGLMNFVIPLQIGSRDLASPFLNTLGFWLYTAGAILINLFFVFGGHFSGAGWLAVAPLSGIEFNPGVGVDYWIWSLQISGIGTTIGAINFIMTILKMRAPGMKLIDMPMFTWASLCSMVLAVTVFPLLTATIVLLNLDRLMGFHFFTTTAGGNAMMYSNLIWMWGHPEVYILILPAFGVFSEVVSTFSGKKLFGRTSAILALILVTALSALVWLHHFFTMGAGANVNAFFGIMTMFIAIPTGVQFVNWIFTMHKGKIRFANPMLWFLGFVATFVIGGLTGVLLAIPPVDFQLHNGLFLVAHFHTQVIGGVVFGLIAGYTYWFPKATGIILNERLGKYAFWFWFVGFWVSFGPLYILGMMGAPRRIDTYDPATGWQPLFIVALIGFALLSLGVVFLILQAAYSIWKRKEHLDTTGGDPWNARTLEWSTISPPPFYNFAKIPEVVGPDAFWRIKKEHIKEDKDYEEFEMPKNTAVGIYISAFMFLIGFGMVWHIFWLAAVGLIGSIYFALRRTFDDHTEYAVSKETILKMEVKNE